MIYSYTSSIYYFFIPPNFLSIFCFLQSFTATYSSFSFPSPHSSYLPTHSTSFYHLRRHIHLVRRSIHFYSFFNFFIIDFFSYAIFFFISFACFCSYYFTFVIIFEHNSFNFFLFFSYFFTFRIFVFISLALLLFLALAFFDICFYSFLFPSSPTS
jgi:hypothetical protein